MPSEKPGTEEPWLVKTLRRHKLSLTNFQTGENTIQQSHHYPETEWLHQLKSTSTSVGHMTVTARGWNQGQVMNQEARTCDTRQKACAESLT